MIEAVYERITKHGLTDWAVVLQGVYGIPSLLERLPAFCVENFANAELDKVAGNNPLLDVIVSLASDSDLPLSELCPQLKKLASFKMPTCNEPGKYGELLHWRVANKPRLGPALWDDKAVGVLVKLGVAC